jgi:hypothetical protein
VAQPAPPIGFTFTPAIPLLYDAIGKNHPTRCDTDDVPVESITAGVLLHDYMLVLNNTRVGAGSFQ